MNSREKPTVADYLATAVCPALIMVFVGSLVFFLQDILIAEGNPQASWILFWFVLAMVLVSRIAIQTTPAYAAIYGLGLAAATAFRLLQMFGFVWQLFLLLGIIWWMTDKLTWDCCFIEAGQDSLNPGRGLVNASDWFHQKGENQSAVRPAATPSIKTPHEAAPDPSKKSARWKKYAALKAQQKHHRPGTWILYFSLAAIPLFGFGELLIPGGNKEKLGRAILWLFIYLLSGGALLFITSFLGFRHYLRARRVQMPLPMVRAWVGGGVAILALVLLGTAVLPRPSSRHSFASHVRPLETKVAPPEKGTAAMDDPSAAEQKREGSQEPQGGGGGAVSDPNKQMGSAPGKTNKAARGEPSNGGEGRLAPTSSSAIEQKLTWIMGGLLLLFLLCRYHREILSWLEELRQWLSRFKQQTKLHRTQLGRRGSERFQFPNPFQSGASSRMTLAELYSLSFAALKEWSRQKGYRAVDSATPLELVEQIADKNPVWRSELEQFGAILASLSYSPNSAVQNATPAEKVWMLMELDSRAAK